MSVSFAEELKLRGFRAKDDVDYAPTLAKRGPHGLCVEVWDHDGLDENAFGQGAIPSFALVYDPDPEAETSDVFEKLFYERPDNMARAWELLSALDRISEIMGWTPPNPEGDRPGLMRGVDDRSIAVAIVRREGHPDVFAAYWDKADRTKTKAGSKMVGASEDLVHSFGLVDKVYEPSAIVIAVPAF